MQNKPALSSPNEEITMLKGLKIHENKEHEQGKTQNEKPRSRNYKATLNNNTGARTTAFERPVVQTGGGGGGG